MAWSFADVSADEQTWMASDYPLLAVQTIPVSPTYKKWVESAVVGANNITNWVDRVLTGYPIRRAYDWYTQYPTRFNVATADTTWYLAFDFGSAITFDCAFLIGHNLKTVAATTVELAISDDNTFRTSLTTIGDFGTPTDDTRLQDLSLAHAADGGRTHDTGADAGPNRYTAQYAWLKIGKGVNFVVSADVGELVLGRRYQTKSNPLNPYDDISLHDERSDARTKGGVVHSTIYHQNRFDLDAEFLAWETARITDFETLPVGILSGYQSRRRVRAIGTSSASPPI
jgi:hypothetical protein